MCPCLDRSRYFLLISASKDAYVASDSQFCQGALDDAGPVFSSCLSRRLRVRLWLSPSAFACGFIVAFVFAFGWFRLVSACFKLLLVLLVWFRLVNIRDYNRMDAVFVFVIVLHYGILCSTPSSSSSLFTSLLLVPCPLCGAPVPFGT